MTPSSTRAWVRLELSGRVQGIGFRPYLFRLARSHRLVGHTRNAGGRVSILWGGDPVELRAALAKLTSEPHPLARIQTIQELWLNEAPAPSPTDFEILESASDEEHSATDIPLDRAPCSDCWQEFRDPADRRYRYPFVACSQCGPRFSILEHLPWDRKHTSLRVFPLCATCQLEYHAASNRRFHAEATGCADCGPRLSWIQIHPLSTGKPSIEPQSPPPDLSPQAQHEWTLAQAISALRAGAIVAVKGVGGFQLLADPSQPETVHLLRHRKHRPHQPFALLASELEVVQRYSHVTPVESALLTGAEAPIVLLQTRSDAPTDPPATTTTTPTPQTAPQPFSPPTLQALVAPHLDELGWMLPASPLHALLSEGFGGPLICTSGNRSGEPLSWTREQALDCLSSLVDGILDHDRTIISPLDDSIARVIDGRPQWLRLGRGTAPRVLHQSSRAETPQALLGLGSQLKNCLAIGLPDRIVVGPHLGDLHSIRTLERQQASAQRLAHLLHLSLPEPASDGPPLTQTARSGRDRQASERVLEPVVDGHPGHSARENILWLSGAQPLPTAIRAETAAALSPSTSTQPPPRQVTTQPTTSLHVVYHHEAHARAGQLEHALKTPFLATVWDGAGDGGDGTLHGGEFLQIESTHVQTIARLRPFPLVGAEAAMREPGRCLLGLLFAWGGEAKVLQEASRLPYSAPRLRLFLQQLQSPSLQTQTCPQTSSMGRLFDAVAALLAPHGLPAQQTYEAQAAQYLEQMTRQFIHNNAFIRAFLNSLNGYHLQTDPSVLLIQSPDQSVLWLDWVPLLQYLLTSLTLHEQRIATLSRPQQAQFGDTLRDALNAHLARIFHQWCIKGLVEVCRTQPELPILLTGGCFQNRTLLEGAIGALRPLQRAVFWPQQLPPNDASISAGQCVSIQARSAALAASTSTPRNPNRS